MPNFINSKEKKAKSIYYVIWNRGISETDGLNKFSKGSYKGPITNREVEVGDIFGDRCRDVSKLFTYERRLEVRKENCKVFVIVTPF